MTDSQFAKSFGWMIFLLLLLTIVLIVLGIVIGGSIDDKLQAQSGEFSQLVVAERTQPVGELKIGKIALSSAEMMIPKPGATATTQPEPSESTDPEPAMEGNLQLANLEIGKTIYNSACYICHNTGVGFAPILGDVDNWIPRISQGLDVLYENSIRGYEGQRGVMPPKGGNLLITDDETRAAVNYMVSVSQ